MRLLLLVSFLVTGLVSACGTTTSSDGGNGTDATADVGSDVAGTDAVDAGPDAVTDAIGNELPLVDTTPDVADTAQTDVAFDTGFDSFVLEMPPADTAPDVFNNGCCQSDSECPKGTLCIPGKLCVPVPPTGSCWNDADCASGKCENPKVCPCTADCSFSYIFGKCSDNAGSCCGGDKGGCLSDEVCVGDQVCKPAVIPDGSCWSDADCKVGTCDGASVCPCGAMCIVADKLGKCVDNVKPGGCCANSASCAVGESCVHGPDVCKSKVLLGKGQCWNDSDCAAGTCTSVNACPCGAMCLIADKPGTCTTPPLTCTTVNPSSFGACDMVLGIVFDGTSCVYASGCGCGNQCGAIFADLATCQKACGI